MRLGSVMMLATLCRLTTAQLLVPSTRMIPRDHDILLPSRAPSDGNSSLERVFTVRNFPAYMGVAPSGRGHAVSDSAKDDILADMSWHVSTATGTIQLHPLVPLEYVYLQQHNAVVGSIWKESPQGHTHSALYPRRAPSLGAHS